MNRWLALIAVSAFVIASCNPFAPAPVEPTIESLPPATAEQVESASPTASEPTSLPPTATETPVPLPTGTATPQPPPTAVVPVSTFAPEASYVLAEERLIGAYAIRMWKNSASPEFSFDNIATISATGQETIQIEWAAAFGTPTGQDLTGEGTPDVVVETFTGGAHCCFSTIVYDLGPAPVKVLETPLSNCAGNFQDLNGDGVYEFVTCDDTFAYAYCSFAASPLVKVIMAYELGLGYVPASPRFPEQYAEDIARHTEFVEQYGGQAGSLGEWDNTTKCSVLPLVLDYLYSGQTDQAWASLEQYYTFPDAADFRAQIEQAVGQSVRYTAP